MRRGGYSARLRCSRAGSLGLIGLLSPRSENAQLDCTGNGEWLYSRPAYAPYMVPKLRSTPWIPDRADHVTSLEGWKRNSKQAKRRVHPQELPIQAWLMYQMRFCPRLKVVGMSPPSAAFVLSLTTFPSRSTSRSRNGVYFRARVLPNRWHSPWGNSTPNGCQRGGVSASLAIRKTGRQGTGSPRMRSF